MLAGSGLVTVRPMVLVVAAALLTGGTARAVPTIDFGILAPTAGAVVYEGGSNPLRGLEISVDFVAGTDTPARAGSFACIGCLLNFQTGNFLAANSIGWLFDGAFGSSFLTLTGGVDTDGNGTPDIGPALLLAGSFVGPQISVDLAPGSPLAVGVSGGLFLDVKNQELAAFFGLPASPYLGFLQLGWTGIGEPGGPIFAVPATGLVRNAFVSRLVPEPGTVLLLGMGLVALTLRRILSR